MSLHLIGKHLLLHLIAVLKKLLDHVIAKDVRHELARVGVKLLEDLFFLIAISLLKLLLDESRAMLVTAKFSYVIVDVLGTPSACSGLESRSRAHLELVTFICLAVVSEFLQERAS